MINNLKYTMKKIISPVLLAGLVGVGTFGCSNKNESKNTSITTEKTTINTDMTDAYTLEKIKDDGFLYTVKTYDAEKSKNQPYEMKNIKKSYNVKCTPAEFKNYVEEKDITWEDLKLTVEKSNFDEYHKSLLVRGINDLQKNNFNIDLSVINYNLKNIEVEYVDSYKENISGTFDCFEHKMTLLKNIPNKKRYEIVFLHEMLGHGMTDAYIEESKVYCSIDAPTYVIDENNNYVGYSLYGQAFTEATAQIIALTALDKDLCEEYISGYDLSMVELLMLCKDNNCGVDEYANYGVHRLIDKMKQNKVDNPYDILGIVSYNLETSEMGETPNILSNQVMYSYFYERIEDELQDGTSFAELNNDMKNVFNYPQDYVLLLGTQDNNQIVVCHDDYINLTQLYTDIGSYACDIVNTKTK